MGKITIASIAEVANVSVGTVDRALNGRGRISEETKRNILQIAEELGYQPNKIASALGRKRKYRIAVITPRNPNFFHKHILSGVLDAQREFSDYGLTVENIPCESLDVDEQRRVLTAFDHTQFDGVAINAGGDALAPLINQIVEDGVPVITFNSDARDSERLLFVGENSYTSGQLSGDMMGRLLGGQGKVGVFTSFFHPGAAMDRRNGFCDTLRNDYPGIEIVVSEIYNDSVERARMVFDAAMREHPDLDGAFSNSASGSVALGDWVYDNPSAKKPVLIGYDVSERVEEYLKMGICDMIIDQEPRRQSYLAVSLLFKHLSEHWMPIKSILEIRSKIVMRFNASSHSMVHLDGDMSLL